MIGLNVVLLLSMSLAPESAKVRRQHDHLHVSLPQSLFLDREVHDHLESGLTTTFECVIDIRSAKVREKQTVLIQIRYQLWEERFLLQIIGTHNDTEEMGLTQISQLAAYFDENPIDIQVVPELASHSSWQASVRLRVLPFSLAEQHRTRQWVTQSVRETEPRKSGDVLGLLVASSIKRQSIYTLKWRFANIKDGLWVSD